MAELSAAAQQLLAAQRKRYLASLKQKAAELRQVAQQMYELQDAVHKIAGSAGLHGLTAIAQQASVVEEAIKDGQTQAQVNEDLENLLLILETTATDEA